MLNWEEVWKTWHHDPTVSFAHVPNYFEIQDEKLIYARFDGSFIVVILAPSSHWNRLNPAGKPPVNKSYNLQSNFFMIESPSGPYPWYCRWDKEDPPPQASRTEVNHLPACHTGETACWLILSHNACCLSAGLLWQMIPYLEGCCLLLLSNVLATHLSLELSAATCQEPYYSSIHSWAHTEDAQDLLYFTHKLMFLSSPLTVLCVGHFLSDSSFDDLACIKSNEDRRVDPHRPGSFSLSTWRIPLLSKRFDPIACEGLMKAACVTHWPPCLFDFHTCIKAK